MSTAESGLRSVRPDPARGIRGSGPFAFNPNGPASGLFQALPFVQKNLGYVPGSPDYVASGGNFCEVPIAKQIEYSGKYLDGWRKQFKFPQWNSVGDMYVCNFLPAYLGHKDDPNYVLVDCHKSPLIYKVNMGLDNPNTGAPNGYGPPGRKGYITVRDMAVAAGSQIGSGVHSTAVRSLNAVRQGALNAGLVEDGLVGTLTKAAITGYQQAKGLPVTGVFDVATDLALFGT